MANFADKIEQGYIPVVSPDGKVGSIPSDKLEQALGAGYTKASEDQIEDKKLKDESSSTSGAIKSALLGAASGLTFGIAPQILRRGTGVDPKVMESLKKEQAGAYITGEIIGSVAPTIISGGGAAPGQVAAKAGRLAKAARLAKIGSRFTPPALANRVALAAEKQIAKKLGSLGIKNKIAQKMVSKAGGQALEGALYGVGQTITEDALGETELNAEALLANMSTGALFGAALPIVTGGIGVAARPLTSRAGKALGKMKDKLSSIIVKPIEETFTGVAEKGKQAGETIGGAVAGGVVGAKVGGGIGMMAGTGLGGLMGTGGMNSINEVIGASFGSGMGGLVGAGLGIPLGASIGGKILRTGPGQVASKAVRGGVRKAFSGVSSAITGIDQDVIESALKKENRHIVNMSDAETMKFAKELAGDIRTTSEEIANVRNDLDIQFGRAHDAKSDAALVEFQKTQKQTRQLTKIAKEEAEDAIIKESEVKAQIDSLLQQDFGVDPQEIEEFRESITKGITNLTGEPGDRFTQISRHGLAVEEALKKGGRKPGIAKETKLYQLFEEHDLVRDRVIIKNNHSDNITATAREKLAKATEKMKKDVPIHSQTASQTTSDANHILENMVPNSEKIPLSEVDSLNKNINKLQKQIDSGKLGSKKIKEFESLIKKGNSRIDDILKENPLSKEISDTRKEIIAAHQEYIDSVVKGIDTDEFGILPAMKISDPGKFKKGVIDILEWTTGTEEGKVAHTVIKELADLAFNVGVDVFIPGGSAAASATKETAEYIFRKTATKVLGKMFGSSAADITDGLTKLGIKRIAKLRKEGLFDVGGYIHDWAMNNPRIHVKLSERVQRAMSKLNKNIPKEYKKDAAGFSKNIIDHLSNEDFYGQGARNKQEVYNTLYKHERSLNRLFPKEAERHAKLAADKAIKTKKGVKFVPGGIPEGKVDPEVIAEHIDFRINEDDVVDLVQRAQQGDEQAIFALNDLVSSSEEYLNASSRVAGPATTPEDLLNMKSTINKQMKHVKNLDTRRQINNLKRKNPLMQELLLLGVAGYFGGPIGLGIAGTGRLLANPRLAVKALSMIEKPLDTIFNTIDDSLYGFITKAKDFKLPKKAMEKAGKRFSAAPIMAQFARQLDVTPKKEETEQQLLDRIQLKLEELNQDPQVTIKTLAGTTQGLNSFAPDMAAHLGNQSMKAMQFLNDKFPKPPVGYSYEWKTPASEFAKFARYVDAVEDPMTGLRNLETITNEQVEVLNSLYPRLYQHIQEKIIDILGDNKIKVPYSKRLILQQKFSIPAETSTTSSAILASQSSFADAAQEKQQQTSKGTKVSGKMSSGEASTADKVANR